MGTPSGKVINLHGVSIVRVVAGKITEFWKNDDSLFAAPFLHVQSEIHMAVIRQAGYGKQSDTLVNYG